MIRVELARLLINERSDEQVIWLREVGGERQFPIVIGVFEAFAIDRLVREQQSERPLTHDLLAAIVEHLDATISRVVIDEVRDSTYYAKVVLRRQAEDIPVDARPSDAITVALRTEAPIYVSERVMKVAAPG